MSIWRKLAAAATRAASGSEQNRPADNALPFTIGTMALGAKVANSGALVSAENALPFTVGMISLSAKMAKSDGGITKDEVCAFKKAFKVTDAEMKDAAHAFNLAKQDVAGYETCAEQLA